MYPTQHTLVILKAGPHVYSIGKGLPSTSRPVSEKEKKGPCTVRKISDNVPSLPRWSTDLTLLTAGGGPFVNQHHFHLEKGVKMMPVHKWTSPAVKGSTAQYFPRLR